MVKNEKGFTLVELLATVVILGIIMLVAVPNVTGIIYKNRANTYVEDAKKLTTLAEYKMRVNNNTIQKPSDGQCIIMDLSYLDNAEFEDPPNGGDYLLNDSFVIIKRDGNEYKYYTQIIEKFKSTYRGVLLNDSKNLYEDGATNLVSNATSSDLIENMADGAKDTLDYLAYVQKFDSSFTCTNGLLAVYSN